MRLLTVSEMKRLEEAANASGYTFDQMMENAGTGIAQLVHARFHLIKEKVVVGLVGSGNNGGDTLIALCELRKLGWQSYAILFKDRKMDDPLIQRFQQSVGTILKMNSPDLEIFLQGKSGIFLDGAIGTGFNPPLSKVDEVVLNEIKAKLSRFTNVAVDCPSGLDCQTGEVTTATIPASITISLEAVKKGLMTYSAFPFCGEIVVVDLGLSKYEKEIHCSDEVTSPEDVGRLLPVRKDISHKGTFGKVIIVGGSVNYPGAPVLAGRGAYAVGTGLVQIAVPEHVYQAVSASALELTWLILDDKDGVISETASSMIEDSISNADCIVVGPGMGREETTSRFIQQLLFKPIEGSRIGTAGFIGVGREKQKKNDLVLPPMVIDADALALISRESDWAKKMKVKGILTPHPGEMAALTGLSIDEIQNDRNEIARKYARLWQLTIVLKGALTVVADETGKTTIIPVASSALAKAGTGDVLAGMIGGFMAQGLNPRDSAVAGAWLHAQSGILAGKMRGTNAAVLASDVIQMIPKIYQYIQK